MMQFLGVIPARYASTRFPGKPLVMIGGKTMIQRVYEQCLKANFLAKVVVATDDDRIFQEVKSFGGEVVMTATHHQSGTDRCLEALQQMNYPYDGVVNVQGDEPFIDPDQINQLVHLLQTSQAQIATLAFKITKTEEHENPNVVKLVKTNQDLAIYFSRFPIPFVRSVQQHSIVENHNFYKHIGIYAYRAEVLQQIADLQPSSLEVAESLEQLRWIENGFSIAVGVTEKENIGIDTPEDMKKIQNFF
jgi:3-deoxy-manno-octulosonate cytidylyltransferase (CMP-KDO synthetase)